MKRISDALINYSGANPFGDTQARSYSDEKLVADFYPISTFWSLFNEQHEILIGTRGSGKTAILKMLSYSRLRRMNDERARKIIRDRSFIGFYVPMRLEFMKALKGPNDNDEKRCEYFEFAFNCAAASAILTEITALLQDHHSSERERLLCEADIVDELKEAWFTVNDIKGTSLKDVARSVNYLFHNQQFWEDGTKPPITPLASSILSPIQLVLPVICELLDLDSDTTNWLACIDEAEFLEKPFQKCINSFLRSEKRPMVVKMATLPYMHVTKETTSPNVSIEPNGNDFDYKVLSLSPSSDEFVRLTDYICEKRLAKCEVSGAKLALQHLEGFIGKLGKDNPLDYFNREFEGTEETEPEQILRNVLSVLSVEKQQRYQEIRDFPEKVDHEFKEKYSPVYYVRRMKLETIKNRHPGWFAGSQVVRKVADGNPRRFIQLMSAFFDKARSTPLEPHVQHRLIVEFAKTKLKDARALPEGVLIYQIVDAVAERLSAKVHGTPMYDAGCRFNIAQNLINLQVVSKALRVAVQYSHVVPADGGLSDITYGTELRISYIHAIKYWLPLRRGDGFTLTANNVDDDAIPSFQADRSNPQRSAKKFVDKLQLDLDLPHEDE